MNVKTFGLVALIVVVLGLAWYAFGTTTPTPTDTNTLPSSQTAVSPENTQPSTSGVTITYTDAGFSPKTVTVPVGTMVTFVNKSSRAMWIGSDDHPTHTKYDSTSKNEHCAASYTGAAPFDECAVAATNGSWSFTFTKAGNWNYHDHVNASMRGVVVVTGTSVEVNAKL